MKDFLRLVRQIGDALEKPTHVPDKEELLAFLREIFSTSNPLTRAAHREIEQHIAELYTAAAEAAARELGHAIDAAFVHDAALLYARINAAQLVAQITRTSLDRLTDVVKQSQIDGLAPRDLSDRIEETGLLGEDRIGVIARTNLVKARNRGNAAAWAHAGVTEVDIVDGTQNDEACRLANGERWPLSKFVAQPLEHPNCRRLAIPVAREWAA